MLSTAQINYARVAMKLSSMLGRRFGVNIVFGDGPKTNGDTVYLPHWDLTDPSIRNGLYGAIAHEAGGHVRLTCFEDIETVARQRTSGHPRRLWHAASNILEDIRIERVLLREYPGMAAYLDAMVKIIYRDYPAADTIDNQWSLALNWSILNFRARLLKQVSLAKLASGYHQAALQEFGGDTLSKAFGIAQHVADLPNNPLATYRVCEIADEFLDVFSPPETKSEDEPPKNNQENGACSGQDQGDQQAGPEGNQSREAPQGGSGDQAPDDKRTDGEGDAESDSTPNESGNASMSEAPEGGASDAADSARSSDAGSDPSQDGQQASNSGGDAATDGRNEGLGQRRLNADVPDILPDDVIQLLAEKLDHDQVDYPDVVGELTIGGAASNHSGNTIDGHLDMHQSFQEGLPFRQRLIASMSSFLCGDTETDDRRRVGRTLDTRNITRVKTDADPKVWKTLHVEEDQSVALQILIDVSGSTRGAVLAEEYRSALALASALDQFPLVETAISYFPSVSNLTVGGAPMLKPFGRPLQSCLKGWPSANGGTPLGHAYIGAMNNFFLTERERKMLFVITDGAPSSVSDALNARATLNTCGIEIYGIVVGASDYPNGIFDDAVMIDKVSELASSMHELVYRHL